MMETNNFQYSPTILYIDSLVSLDHLKNRKSPAVPDLNRTCRASNPFITFKILMINKVTKSDIVYSNLDNLIF